VTCTEFIAQLDDLLEERVSTTLRADLEEHLRGCEHCVITMNTTRKTIEIYLALLEKHKNVGIALQAYMRRSEADLSALLDRGGRVRLVKGAYREGRDVVYPNREEVRKNYSRLMHALFERGDNFTIATHDSALIEEAKRLSDSHHVKFEFAMLRGIRDELKSELVRSGYRVVEYIPYGDQWYAYSIRRMKEHPSNVWLLLRSLL